MFRETESKPAVLRYLILFAFVLPFLPVCGKNKLPVTMEHVFGYTEKNQLSLGHFETEFYLKFNMNNTRRNIGMRLIPFIGRQEGGTHADIGESTFRMEYTAPGILNKKEIAFYSTMPYMRNLRDLIIASIQLSAYRPTLMRDRLLSPMHKSNRHYYRYKVSSRYILNDQIVQRISFRPRHNNPQLLTGWMDVIAETGQVLLLNGNFNYNTQRIFLYLELGHDGLERLLPTKIRLHFDFKFLGNKSYSYFDVTCKHTDLQPYDPVAARQLLHKHGHDLTFLNHLNIDSTTSIHNLDYFEDHRPEPLSVHEDSIFQRFKHKVQIADSLKINQPKEKKFLNNHLEDIFLGSHYVRLGSSELIKLPPIFTPSMIEWSNRKGFSLKTRIRLNCDFDNGGYLISNLHLGYNFKKNKIFWKLPTDWMFSPRLNGTLHLDMGNGNQIYNSAQAEDIRENLRLQHDYDSLLHTFDRYTFNYYNDFYAKGGVSLQPLPGLTLKGSVVYHDRSLVEWNDVAARNGMDRHHRSLAPNVFVEWTPGLYYYVRQGQRVPLYSKWPTLSAEYERGLPIMNGNHEYERYEFELKHRFDFKALRMLYVRFGGGFYTLDRNTYFVDYSNFRDNSLPATWLDKMNGQFEALDARWYNESDYYARLCTSYESPMLLFSRLPLVTRFIKRERIYCNLLTVRSLRSFTELGYSVGTPLFDIGGFIGFAQKGRVSFGWNIALRFFENN